AHARALNAMAGPAKPRTALDTILKRERWHGRGGSWVADAIYGVNDGLGAVFGIVSGVAGATNNQQHYVLISGLAGMLASSLSMGAGAYLAVKSEGEVYEVEIGDFSIPLHRRRGLHSHYSFLFYDWIARRYRSFCGQHRCALCCRCDQIVDNYSLMVGIRF